MLQLSFNNFELRPLHSIPGATYLFILFWVMAILMPQTGFSQTCSTKECHGNILKYKFLHTPVKEGECLQCHQKQDNAEKHPTEKTGNCTVNDTGESLCLQCHESVAGQFEHGPAASGACTACHNPHGSNEKNLLHAPLQELCLGCHEDLANEMNKAIFIHSAIDDLDCSACHLPHSSGFAYLLKGETSESCFECHENIEAKFKRSINKHDPLYSGSQCANCHFAHSSNFSALLKWDGNDTCLHCHSKTASSKNILLAATLKIDISDKEYVHAPIEDSGCSACHDAHGSRYSSLLTAAYPSSFYSGYKKDSYALCFECHDADLLTERNRTTDFRNGITNLHTIHVADKLKGRTCKACHNFHASNGEKLINPEGIPFGDWKIPIRFEATDTGGSCMPGCHRVMKYDRRNKVDNSKEAAEKNALEAEEPLMEFEKSEKDEKDDSEDVIQPQPISIIRQSFNTLYVTQIA